MDYRTEVDKQTKKPDDDRVKKAIWWTTGRIPEIAMEVAKQAEVFFAVDTSDSEDQSEIVTFDLFWQDGVTKFSLPFWSKGGTRCQRLVLLQDIIGSNHFNLGDFRRLNKTLATGPWKKPKLGTTSIERGGIIGLRSGSAIRGNLAIRNQVTMQAARILLAAKKRKAGEQKISPKRKCKKIS